MKSKKTFSVRERLNSFSHAFAGLNDMILTEPNAKIHLLITAIILLLSWWLGINGIKFGFIVVSIVMVWVAETFNTVMEIVMDYVTSHQYSPMIKRAKDISACAVLISSMGGLVIGLIILGPPLIEKIQILWGQT